LAGSTAGLERARASARWFLGSLGMRLLCRAPTSVEWLLGSPRMRRVLAAQSGLVLALGVATVAVDHHSPDLTREPLALVSALPPADGGVSPPAPPAPRPGPGPRRLHRSTTTVPQRRPRSPARPTRTAAPARPTTTVARGWAYWAPRIRFCESRGNY